MALTSSTSNAPLDAAERRMLLEVARTAIADGLRGGEPRRFSLEGYTAALCAPAATFVTLQLAGALRGCVGTLEAVRALVLDAASNAYAAAYRDPRFPPLTAAEFERLDIRISILSAPQPLVFTGEDDLIQQLRPGIDGLILSERGRRGTFLPAVWESVPQARDFLRELKVKAGLPPHYWSDSIQIARYTTTCIP